ncbi:DUF3871 family protein [Altibacter sp. HG106]|uniref:DUF3871 family protein n=1 Tax=Altibacter sp. HG106 TaxID=3023937 RepID=UPI0023510370|nr:DUF3871 family protein [Altibacter sp. HG106]MDC7994036.1 DUF3871 family protein [Altibacter sp. HG106]
MELTAINKTEQQIVPQEDIIISKGNFIEANTEQVTLEHLRNDCIIPVYPDNETTISHASFIEATGDVTKDVFSGQTILRPNIRISHIIKGRVPSAIGKAVKDLRPDEKTIYYQRCAFIIELPQIKCDINGNSLSLTIGGVRALNQENLYSKRTTEKFKVFIGFKNQVCTNLCIATDGLNADIRVTTINELKDQIKRLIQSFSQDNSIMAMQQMSHSKLSEKQFAHLIGKMRMYQHLPKIERSDLFPLKLSDNQINTVVKEYYTDANFSRSDKNSINLWKLYNLLTSANKSSYIDSNLERNVSAYELVRELSISLKNNTKNWFLDI